MWSEHQEAPEVKKSNFKRARAKGECGNAADGLWTRLNFLEKEN
jgi:hypothetical protein